MATKRKPKKQVVYVVHYSHGSFGYTVGPVCLSRRSANMLIRGIAGATVIKREVLP